MNAYTSPKYSQNKRPMRSFFIIIFLMISGGFHFQSSNAKIICVPDDSSTIQAGINGASGGDTVLVSKGLYYERINFLGKGILVASNFIFDQDTNTIDSTIIDADADLKTQNSGIIGTSDTGSVVCFLSGEDSSSRISGFTIRNGWGFMYSEWSSGGGIVCSSSSPQISYNKIVNNTAFYGGGICCLGGDSSPLIIGNRFVENHAAIGGAILCESSSPLIIDNVFLDNHANNKGGAIFFKICSPIIINNHMEKNTTDGSGGGICGHSGYLTLLENKIIQNSCMTKGGGLYCAALFSALIGNNLFYKNSAQNGGGIYCHNCSSSVLDNTMVENSSTQGAGGILCSGAVYHPTIINNIIGFSPAGEGIRCENNSTPFISYNDLWSNASGNFFGCPDGVGDTSWGANFNGTHSDSFYNIIQDPLFVDTVNFKLSCNSPCIDAGDPSYYVPPDSGGCRSDVGFQEYPYILGDANSDGSITPYSFKHINPGRHLAPKGSVTIGDVVFMANYLFMDGIPPCPFHSADTNCDGEVNIADVVCLLNYLFCQGPLPCQFL
jgi:predicted outer membrane repeat protein